MKDLEDAVKAAQAIYDDPNADQDKVDKAKANVEAKLAALKAKAKKDALNLAIIAAEGDAALVDKIHRRVYREASERNQSSERSIS